MPAWPGGPCPQCGDEMPARVVHCRNCRCLLNDDLDDDTVVEPVFVPLQELAAVVRVEPQGTFCECPACARELKAKRKYEGKVVRCNHCSASFTFGGASRPKAYYGDCPHCSRELRVGAKYLTQRVACNFCSGELEFHLTSTEQAASG